MSETVDFAYRTDVDNHIGVLYSLLPSYKFIPAEDNNRKHRLNMKNHVHILSNFIDQKVAQEVRSFLKMIPFDDKLQPLNSTDNQPRSVVYSDIITGRKGKREMDKYEKKTATYAISRDTAVCNRIDIVQKQQQIAKKWTYENYRPGIWRVLPLTVEGFIDSPIYDLINILAWQVWRIIDAQFKEDVQLLQMVLQRTPTHSSIGKHTDECGTRYFSFIYYLTSDEWCKDDGGELVIEKKNGDTFTIAPKFNTLVLWKLRTSGSSENIPSIYHWVTPNLAPPHKPRFAIVGFFKRR